MFRQKLSRPVHLLSLGISFAPWSCTTGVPQQSETPAHSESALQDRTPAPAVPTEPEPIEQHSPQDEAAAGRAEAMKSPPSSCADPKLQTYWMDEKGPPSSDWWHKIADIEPRPPHPGYYPGVRAPTVRMALSSASSLPRTTRVYRQNFGRYRVCYEAGLSKDPNLTGHWVARIAHVGPVCSLEVVDTDLPDSVSQCLAQAFKDHVAVPETSGLVEVILAFQAP